MYVRNKKMKHGKHTYYVLEDRIKIKEKYITKNIRYLGTAQKILNDLKELDKRRQNKKTLT